MKIPPKKLGLMMWRTRLINNNMRESVRIHEPDQWDFSGTLFTLGMVLTLVVGIVAAYREAITSVLEGILGI